MEGVTEPFARLVDALNRRAVRFVLIGLAGANRYALDAGLLFTTRDFDLFLPPEPENLLAAWHACTETGLELFLHDEPLDFPRDGFLAARVVERLAVVRGDDGRGLRVDLTLVMVGMRFEEVWTQRRTFLVEGVPVPVAPLAAIVASKVAADRPKDRLFLAAHEDALRQLLGHEPSRGRRARGGGERPTDGPHRPDILLVPEDRLS